MNSSGLFSGWLWRGIWILTAVLLLAVLLYALVQVVTSLGSGVQV